MSCRHLPDIIETFTRSVTDVLMRRLECTLGRWVWMLVCNFSFFAFVSDLARVGWGGVGVVRYNCTGKARSG